MTSFIHFVKIELKCLQNSLDLDPGQVFNIMLCQLSFGELGVNNCLINPFMTEFN